MSSSMLMTPPRAFESAHPAISSHTRLPGTAVQRCKCAMSASPWLRVKSERTHQGAREGGRAGGAIHCVQYRHIKGKEREREIPRVGVRFSLRHRTLAVQLRERVRSNLRRKRRSENPKQQIMGWEVLQMPALACIRRGTRARESVATPVAQECTYPAKATLSCQKQVQLLGQ